MIEVFEGRLGGGKTYSAVERMVKYFASGGCVYSNIELKLESVRKLLRKRYAWDLQDGQYVFLSEDQIQHFHRLTPPGTPESPTLVVLDEAQLWFNARDWSQTSRELLAFLTQSRKQCTDIIFISQSLLNMDKQFMRLVQWVWTFTDLKKVRVPYFRFIHWPFNQILQCQYQHDGRTLQQRHFLLKDPMIFDCYNTFVLLRSFPRLEGAQTNFKGKGRIKLSWPEFFKRLAIVPVLIGLLVAGGCRYVQVNDVRSENLRLRELVKELSGKVARLEGYVRGTNSFGAVVSRGGSAPVVSASAVNPVPDRPHVVAVVQGRVGLSNGHWVSVGDVEDGLGQLFVADPSNGRTHWRDPVTGKESNLSCN